MKENLWPVLKESIIGGNRFIETPFGKRLLTYGDYTASGRGVLFIERYFERLMEEYGNTHTDDDHTGEITTARLHIAENKIKSFLNAGDDYCIIEVGSGATGAINRLQEILGIYVPPVTKRRFEAMYNEFLGKDGAREFQEFLMSKRPVVFIGPYEHHSNEISWRECFAEVVEIELDSKGELDLRDLEKKLKNEQYSNRMKIGSFSAASNVSGIITPVYKVAEILHENDAYAFFDFAAAAPYREIDVNRNEKSYFDAVFFSPHKFLGGPGSCGILVFRRVLYHGELPPTYSGGGTVDFVNFNTQQYSHAIEIREKPGTPPILQTLRAALALELKDLLGLREIEKRESELIEKALKRFEKMDGVKVFGPRDPSKRLGIFSFTVRSGDAYLHPRFVVKLMNDLFGIQARAGCSCAGPYGHRLLGISPEKSLVYYDEIVTKQHKGIKPGWARINLHFVMDDEEVDFILDAIEYIADYGRYLLPLYDFDISSGSWRAKDSVNNRANLSLAEWVEEWIGSSSRESSKDRENGKVNKKSLFKAYLADAVKIGEEMKKSFSRYNLRYTRTDLIPYIYCS